MALVAVVVGGGGSMQSLLFRSQMEAVGAIDSGRTDGRVMVLFSSLPPSVHSGL
jgi:hypothetical protein